MTAQQRGQTDLDTPWFRSTTLRVEVLRSARSSTDLGAAVIHAMPMRTKYRQLLPPEAEVTVHRGMRADGTPITDEVVEAMADQAEQGYDDDGPRRRAPVPARHLIHMALGVEHL